MRTDHRSRRLARLVIIAVALGVLGVSGLSGCGASGSSPTPKTTTTDGDVVARVGGRDVTRAQVDAVRAEARLAGRSDDADAAREEAIRRALVSGEARRLGVGIDEEAVRRRVSGVEEDVGGVTALESALERASMTRGQLGQAVRFSLLAQAVADAKNADLKAKPDQVRAFYDRHRGDLYTSSASLDLRKITVPGRKLAAKLVRRLRRGASFAELARQYSMDPETRFQGGKLGWVSASTVPEEVLAAVERATPEGIADPVWSSGKWQVFKVVARRPSRVVPFADAQGAIARELTRRRRARALDRWIDWKLQRVTVVRAP